MRYYRVSVTNRERLLSAPGGVLTKTTLTGSSCCYQNKYRP